MPNLPYSYHARGAVGVGGGATCGAGPAANLNVPAFVRAVAWPNLAVAQAQLGIYPAGWAAHELAWRQSSLRVSSGPLGAAGAMVPSPVMIASDPTDKGQLAYHLGMAAGLECAMQALVPAPGIYFPFHLTRAITNGATFTFAGLQRPDLVVFSVNIAVAPPVLAHFVVWECKGHSGNVGQAPLGPALTQSLALTNMTALPGVAPFAAPVVPAAYVASQVDLTGAGGNYRLQVTDPPGDGPLGGEMSPGDADNFLRAFYAPYIEVLNDTPGREVRTYEGRKFETVAVTGFSRFGVDKKIVEILASNKRNLYAEIGSSLAKHRAYSSDQICLSENGLSIEINND